MFAICKRRLSSERTIIVHIAMSVRRKPVLGNIEAIRDMDMRCSSVPGFEAY